MFFHDFYFIFLRAELLYNSLFNYVTKEILALKAHNFKVFTDWMKTGTDIYLFIVNDTKS